ncbi:hypothetical protein FA13DRAFT_250919 [Coprinellus micaceus]|uniref:Uncharacterized protein n=1 Tax=Coprinellus micaceus TaxID=71717 RepID=A0A4Y7TDZ5_COPMI|nr:hypothetical protein FA13DRAFT_250919 [Coprinellus micaceus]
MLDDDDRLPDVVAPTSSPTSTILCTPSPTHRVRPLVPAPHPHREPDRLTPNRELLFLTRASALQHIPDPAVSASGSASAVLASSSSGLAQGTATRAHPRPPATARAKQGEYMPSHRQQLQQPQLAIVTQPSAAAQPVLFDFDMDAEWHQTGAQFEAQQQQQQFALNLSLNNPSLSPASSFSSLSPTQVPLPLTPGIPGVPTMPQQLQQQQHGGGPLSTASMSNNTTPSGLHVSADSDSGLLLPQRLALRAPQQFAADRNLKRHAAIAIFSFPVVSSLTSAPCLRKWVSPVR